MLLAGQGCADVAKAVGVARQTVYTWKGLLDEGGIDALRAVPERGRPAQLDEQQLAAVRATLLRSPTEYGFGTELLILKRVGGRHRAPAWSALRANTGLANLGFAGLQSAET